MSEIVSEQTHGAGCLCGAVRIRTVGKPLRTGLCHCFDCRKAHAAPFNAFAIFAVDSVSITGPEDSELDSAALGAYDNGRGYTLHFCRACGSRIYGAYASSSEIELYLGLFDETSLWTPTYECWVIRRESWLGDMPTVFSSYEKDRPDPANLPG